MNRRCWPPPDGTDVELPGSDAVLRDSLLLLTVARDVEPITRESDRHARRGRDLLQPRLAVSAELFEKFRVQVERAGQSHLDPLRLAEPHPVGRIEQQPTWLYQLSECTAYQVVTDDVMPVLDREMPILDRAGVRTIDRMGRVTMAHMGHRV